jgi:D-arabinose 5-phosphate isomerase GutQ
MKPHKIRPATLKISQILSLTISKGAYGMIRDFRGRPIIKGRKNAIMANKIVVTVHPTATPSLFLHAAYTIHGDLGRVQNECTVSATSK